MSTSIRRVLGDLSHAADQHPRRVLWMFFALLVMLRFPAQFHHPSFWAEEGNIYFAYAANHGFWDSLTATHVGYYSVVANVAGIVSTWVPLEYAVLTTRIFGLISPAVFGALVIQADAPRRSRALALIVTVFTCTVTAEWASAIHAQFWLCAALLMVVAVQPTTRLARWSQYALAAVAPLAGAVSTFALLACAVAAVRWRERRMIVITAIGAVAAGIQFLVSERRHSLWKLGQFIAILFIKLVWNPLTGTGGDQRALDWYRSWPSHTAAALFLLAFTAWVVLAIVATDGRWRLVILGAVAAGVGSLWFALGPYDMLPYADLVGRYALIGVVVVLVAVALRSHRLPLVPQAVVLALSVGAAWQGARTGAQLTEWHSARGDVWAEQVAAAQADAGVTLQVSPGCHISVDSRRQRAGFVIESSGRPYELTVAPADVDASVDVGVFVLAQSVDGSIRLLTPDGWQGDRLFFFGEPGNLCLSGFGTVPPDPRLGIIRGRSNVELPRLPIDQVPASSRVDVLVGRDFADALAKEARVTLDRCEITVTCG